MKNCETCAHWRSLDLTRNDLTLGECRRSAPVITHLGTRGVWAQTRGTDGCGEHAAIEGRVFGMQAGPTVGFMSKGVHVDVTSLGDSHRSFKVSDELRGKPPEPTLTDDADDDEGRYERGC